MTLVTPEKVEDTNREEALMGGGRAARAAGAGVRNWKTWDTGNTRLSATQGHKVEVIM